MTVVLTCTADGQFLPPMIVFKGKTDRMIRSLIVPDGFLVCHQVFASINDHLMTRYIDELWIPHVHNMATSESILTLNSFSAHVSESTMSTFRANNVHTAIVPGAAFVQPVNVCISKSFQGLLESYYQQYMFQELKKLEKSNKKRVPKPSRQIVVHWIEAVWHAIRAKQNAISQSFLLAGIDQDLVDNDDVVTRSALREEIDREMEEVYGNEPMIYQDSTTRTLSDNVSEDSSDSEEMVFTMFSPIPSTVYPHNDTPTHS